MRGVGWCGGVVEVGGTPVNAKAKTLLSNELVHIEVASI